MEHIKYEKSWCEYLTPCPHFKEMMVGSYECLEECSYCAINQTNINEYVDCEYEDFLKAGRENPQYFRRNPIDS